MTRLSTSGYLANRSELLVDWLTKLPVLARLSFIDQRTLHEYFAFTQRLNDTEAVAHRKAVTAIYRSLPHRAGKAMKRFVLLSSIDWAAEHRKQESIGQKRQHIRTAHGLLRPNVNLEQIAGAVLSQLMDELGD